MRIDRCVCFDVPFSDLAVLARSTGAGTVEALQAQRPFGHTCGLCHPYVRRMLRTGETVFREIVDDADEPVDAEGAAVPPVTARYAWTEASPLAPGSDVR